MAETQDLRPQPSWATTDGHIGLAGPAQDAPARALDKALAPETLYRFAFSFGERRRDVLTDCFTEDATFTANIGGDQPFGPYEGREEIVTWLTSYWDKQTDQRRHFVTNAMVDDLTAETATVTAMLLLAASEDGAMRTVTAGFYRVEMRKEADGAWRIARFGAGYDAPY